MGAAPTRGARFREALLASRRQSLAQRFFRSLQGHGIGVGNGEGVKGRVHVTRIESIQAVSRRSGVASSALRYYEERGLIASQRARSGHRRYPRAALRRIAFIVYAQRIGLSLEEIGAELDDGVVTIALAEADSAEIEKRRAELAEPYRSLLGHFRHEVGHHYWDILVRDGGKLDQCRAVFGDDSQDYEAALKRHYERSAPADWAERFVSAYATSHPWEDFAETWAHYLHIVDTLETANAFGVRIAPSVDREGAHSTKLNFDPYSEGSIERIIDAWAPFVVAMNSVNRAMGRPDLYPFIIAPAVVEKLRFIHDSSGARRGT
jgi:hypothetical protein